MVREEPDNSGVGLEGYGSASQEIEVPFSKGLTTSLNFSQVVK